MSLQTKDSTLPDFTLVEEVQIKPRLNRCLTLGGISYTPGRVGSWITDLPKQTPDHPDVQLLAYLQEKGIIVINNNIIDKGPNHVDFLTRLADFGTANPSTFLNWKIMSLEDYNKKFPTPKARPTDANQMELF